MMAWELQRQMYDRIAPSIFKVWQEARDTVPCWLNKRYADQRWDYEDGDEAYDALVAKARGMSEDTLIREIAEKAVEYSTTTNGSFEVYLDDFTSIPWCTEDEYLTWVS